LRYLTGEEEYVAMRACERAAEIARNSKCRKSKNGAVIVNDGKIIGEGWNTPVPDVECDPCLREDIHDNSRVELCHSIHAEVNSILDALGKGRDVRGGVMYHARIKDGRLKRSNTPSCTGCSRFVQHVGLEGFVLIQETGYAFYTAEEFNRESFAYFARQQPK
jgi:tRNA(Arg) A34 adenosine deaminase TadA